LERLARFHPAGWVVPFADGGKNWVRERTRHPDAKLNGAIHWLPIPEGFLLAGLELAGAKGPASGAGRRRWRREAKCTPGYPPGDKARAIRMAISRLAALTD